MKKFVKYAIIILIVTAIIVLSFIIYNSYQNKQRYEKSDFSMDTLFTQIGYGRNCENVFNDVFDIIKNQDNTFSRFNSNSEISLINENVGNWVNVSKETFELLKEAAKLCRESDGVFDITLGAVIDIWDITAENHKVPSQEEINKAMETVSYEFLEFNESNYSVRITNEGTVIDLGGLIKGYATDTAALSYKDNNISSALISTNSSIYTCGAKPENEQYVLGIRDPRGTVNDYIGTLKVQDTFVGSSGDYERYFEEDGIRYHHIMDSSTGRPANNGIIGITVLAESGLKADYLSTYLFVMGIDYVKEHINEYQVIVVDLEKNVYVSESLENSFDFDDQSGYTLY